MKSHASKESIHPRTMNRLSKRNAGTRIGVAVLITYAVLSPAFQLNGAHAAMLPMVSLGTGAVSQSTNEANANSSYTVLLTLGSGGALTGGSGTITVQFPDNTLVPGSIATSEVTVNGVTANAVTPNSATREVTVTVPNSLANNASVSLAFSTGAGLLNPSTAGAFSLQVRSSAEPAPVASPTYAIAPAITAVTVATVTPTPTSISTASAYHITFNLGAHGRLIANSSTLTLTFNSATTVSNGSLSGVQINSVNATATGNSAGKTITLTVPASLNLGNGAAVTVDLPASAITNPATGGYYTLVITSSVEATNVASNVYTIEGGTPPPATGQDLPIPGSGGQYSKPNQNRPFFHDGKWWTAARLKSDGAWYLWKLDGTTWTTQVMLDTRASARPDCYIDPAANKVYILMASSSGSGSKVARLSYASGAWSMDSGFPVALVDFTFTGEYGIVITKASNGEFWVVRYKNSQLDAQKSTDNCATWSSPIVIKSGIFSKGLADAVAFSSGGSNYIGVGYGENTGVGNVFGFLKHKDGDPDGTWSDETGSMTQPANAESDDHMALAVGSNNEIFFAFKTHTNASSAAGIGLFKRASGGGWQTFAVQIGSGWTRPAVVVDETLNELYVFGTQESDSELGQYRKCAIGNESALASADIVTIFSSGTFNNVSVPQRRVNSSTGILICAENTTTDEIWYNVLPIGGGGGVPPTPLVANSVIPNTNTATVNATYTIGITLGSTGALSGGSSTIAVTWPSGTIIPASIANSAVTVNGVNASAVTTTPATRLATVTVPSSLANSASVTLAFAASAGITNPAAGNYTLQVHTSTQLSDVNSPTYAIQAVTPVVVSTITVTQNFVGQAAAYTVPLTLGSVGGLSGGSGTITVTWPNDTSVPVSISPAQVTINSVAAANVSTVPASRQAVVTVPNNLANNGIVTMLFAAGAGIGNPSIAASYVLQAQTSAQPVNANSPSYAIQGLNALVVGNVTVTPDSANRTASSSLPITLGNAGALTGGSGTITVTWPDNTQIPVSMSNAAVTINGAAASNVATVPAARQAVVTVPNNLPNSASFTLLFASGAGIVNPSTANNYTLQVHTSSEAADVASPAYVINPEPPPPPVSAGNVVHVNTSSNLEKSNQSKLFYYQQKWWLIAYDESKAEWALWKYVGGNWTRGVRLDIRAPIRLDAVFSTDNDRLYFVSAHANQTKFARYAVVNGTWTQELRVNITNFGFGPTNTAASLARAKNGELWLFRIDNGQLEAVVSLNNGQTWSSKLILKSGITGAQGNTDALTFAANGSHVGVFYGMAAFGGGMEYGFLQHKDGDATTAWTDESASLDYFGTESSSNIINAAAANNGRLYCITQNSKANTVDAVKNTLYVRNAAGNWNKRKVNVGYGWRSPVVGIDASNNRVFVAGIRTTSPNLAEYKSCAYGDEATLETQTPAVLLQHDVDEFGELTAPGQTGTIASGLMICGGNTTSNDTWYAQINLGIPKGNPGAEQQPELAAQNEPEVGAYPNPFNPTTTIRFRLLEANNVRLHIFNLRGELVRTLVDQEMNPGVHERRWNGRDRSGNLVASGVYFYRLEMGARVLQGRLQMLK